MAFGRYRLQFALYFAAIPALTGAPRATQAEIARWETQAKRVNIVRDDWGIAHIHGVSDADAVFGMLYTQAEDDFPRVETNYLNALGRLAEAEGEKQVIQDLRMKLFIDPGVLVEEYTASPAWLKALMDAFADGLNYYLYKHPGVKPRVIQHFEPWMALSFTEGSIGGDIERVDLAQLERFYAHRQMSQAPASDPEPRGSNGIAIAPANTAAHHSLLLINPHTTFFFRSELQVTSEEGLNAYGAVTWGQFFIYQGFNAHAGWMHTSSGVDAIDEYVETIQNRDEKYSYRYGTEDRPVQSASVVIPYKTASGLARKSFTVYRTHHGPVIRAVDGKWVTIRLMQKHTEALMQSYLRTKANNYSEYLKTMELKADSSNNTIFADANGDIAYFHGNFIPKREPRFDWTKPVDGSDPATEWNGLLAVEDTPHVLNPPSGWLYNANDWPWTAAGPGSLNPRDYPAYVEMGGESARGRHALRVLTGKSDFTLESLVAAAYDTYLPWFEKPLPALIRAWDELPSSSALRQKTGKAIALLREWDLRWGVSSVPTSLAVFWGEDIRHKQQNAAKQAGMAEDLYIASRVPPEALLASFASALDRLRADFGTWKTEWGSINRFQRLTGDLQQPFNDRKPSTPVGFTSSTWGSLASFGAKPYPGTKRWYGTSGNSFVAAVEFSDPIRAVAVTAGGESGHPESPHFNDEATRYSVGNLREVYFRPEQLAGHIERRYHPGE